MSTADNVYYVYFTVSFGLFALLVAFAFVEPWLFPAPLHRVTLVISGTGTVSIRLITKRDGEEKPTVGQYGSELPYTLEFKEAPGFGISAVARRQPWSDGGPFSMALYVDSAIVEEDKSETPGNPASVSTRVR